MKKSILMLMVLIFSFIQASFAQVSTWNFEVKDRHSSGKFSYNIPMAIVAVANTDINYSQAFYLPATTDTYIFMRAVASEVGTEDINLFWQFASDPSVVTASWITEATDSDLDAIGTTAVEDSIGIAQGTVSKKHKIYGWCRIKAVNGQAQTAALTFTVDIGGDVAVGVDTGDIPDPVNTAGS